MQFSLLKYTSQVDSALFAPPLQHSGDEEDEKNVVQAGDLSSSQRDATHTSCAWVALKLRWHWIDQTVLTERR